MRLKYDHVCKAHTGPKRALLLSLLLFIRPAYIYQSVQVNLNSEIRGQNPKLYHLGVGDFEQSLAFV